MCVLLTIIIKKIKTRFLKMIFKHLFSVFPKYKRCISIIVHSKMIDGYIDKQAIKRELKSFFKKTFLIAHVPNKKTK